MQTLAFRFILSLLLLGQHSGWAADDSQAKAREAEKQILAKYQWVKGPGVAKMKDMAEIQVPAGYMFTDSKGAQELLNLMGNPTNGRELGFFAPTNFFTRAEEGWFVIYEFDDVGFVKDDEKDKLDADAMLKAITQGTEAGNEERKKMGSPPITITGWHTKPKYNAESHNLEWAISFTSEGHAGVNYNTRILGRKGVMEASLVVAPQQLDATLPTFKEQLQGFGFQSGQKYAEYKQGDKIAKYGLAALIVGGAAAGAAKLGLLTGVALFFKKAWKLVVMGVVAVGAFFKKIFGRILGFQAPTKDD